MAPNANVLITSASRKVGLVRAFQAAFDGRGRVLAVDASPLAPALYVADQYRIVPRSDAPDFFPFVLELCQRERVALVVPTRDEELPLFASRRTAFERQGTRVLVPTLEVVETCQDKQRFVEFCQQNGFAVPHTFAGDTWRRAAYPLFAKPRFGKGSAGAQRLDSVVEAARIFDGGGDWVVQEYDHAPEFSVDVLAGLEGGVVAAVPRRREIVIAGETHAGRTLVAPRLVDGCFRLAEALGLSGVATLQCFWDGDEPRFIEVNPRFGGGAALTIAAGVDMPRLLLDMLDGRTPRPRPGAYEADLVMLRYADNLYRKISEAAPEAHTISGQQDDPVPLPDARSRSLFGERPHGRPRSMEADATFRFRDGGVAQPSGNDSPCREGIPGGVEAVLFDLDNTLYAEADFVRGGFRAVASDLARESGRDEAMLLERMFEILAEYGRGRVFNRLLAELGLEQRVAVSRLLWLYRTHPPCITLYPGMAALLSQLQGHGVRLGLVTDGMASVQRRKIAALGLEADMAAVVCTGEMGCDKTSVTPFALALERLRVAADQAVYIGDDAGKDFASPNRLGMKTIQLCTGGLVGVEPAPGHEAAQQALVRVHSADALWDALTASVPASPR